MTDSAYKHHLQSSPLGQHKLLALIPPCCLDSAKGLHKQIQVTMQEVGVSHKQNRDICCLINKDLDGQLPKVWFSLITKQNTFSICNPLPTPKRKIKPTYSLWFTEDKRKEKCTHFGSKEKEKGKEMSKLLGKNLISCTKFLSSRSPLKRVDIIVLIASGHESLLCHMIKQIRSLVQKAITLWLHWWLTYKVPIFPVLTIQLFWVPPRSW